ncbi:response regulator [Dyella nitratireducens]|uniref:Response regulator n=1 Tax=Dyella nitratireducens TaxID=1849580 RepID=A0ABQ1FTG6_9GAMM|nr:response regulator [Dyella nitratireducens]GGA30219.1 response regulator [Dyella nitratireducens]GLQ43033.1 response regulator [Dyella nitratireducens]
MSTGAPDILLIDDSPTTADLFKYALKVNKSQVTIQAVYDGQAALDMLLGNGQPSSIGLPQLILLDMHLPRLDGLEVLTQLRAAERTMQVPVLIYSGSDADEAKAEAMQHGANGYVCKPAGFKETCVMIRQIEEQWLMRAD